MKTFRPARRIVTKTVEVLLVAGLWMGTTSPSPAQAAEDLTVLDDWIMWSDAENRLRHHLSSQALRLLEARRKQIAALKSAEDWKKRQSQVKAKLREILGPFPERTPLQARVTGVVDKEGFRVEKIVFESRPGFHVTGCLFIPEDVSGKTPAILNVIGHTDIAFRAPGYQQLLLNLVRKGFIVFAIDPIGQGERLQYYKAEFGRSLVGRPTSEHSYFGKQCFLTGMSPGHYFTWDGIRAIDYLVSRPEVDPDRIGVTGISGGGTQTSYIAAVDDRVLAAAPACYITSFRRLLESIGPQDAEQNFNRGLVNGIDHADFLEARAPKPTLVVATTRDFFSIQGVRETVAEARGAFQALGNPENLVLVEDDHGHGYTRKNREALYAFFQKHLDLPGPRADEEVEMLTLEELQVTPTGQLLDSIGGETVFSLNRSRTEELFKRLQSSRNNLENHLDGVRNQARTLCGYEDPAALTGVTFLGRYNREGHVLERYVMSGEGQGVIPFLFFVPEHRSIRASLIYLHPQGKNAASGPGEEIEWFVKHGFAVLAPDLSGTGELGDVNNAITFLALQVGRSLVGLRAGEIGRCVQFLRSREVNTKRIVALARGGMSVPLLHAALFQPLIAELILLEPLVSMRSVSMNRFYRVDFADLVPNALLAYDLADLKAALAPRRMLLLIDPLDHLLGPAGPAAAGKEFQIVQTAYRSRGAAANFAVRYRKPGEALEVVLSAWLN